MKRSILVVAVMAAMALSVTPSRAAVNVITSPPGAVNLAENSGGEDAAANGGYISPVSIAVSAGPVTYVNLDPLGFGGHDVTSVAKKAGVPLFKSATVDGGETATVEGLENAEQGVVYEFFCSIHPNMKGSLVVV